jgi:hypothetical protein
MKTNLKYGSAVRLKEAGVNVGVIREGVAEVRISEETSREFVADGEEGEGRVGD